MCVRSITWAAEVAAAEWTANHRIEMDPGLEQRFLLGVLGGLFDEMLSMIAHF
jgi:hypothetical protein